MSARRDSFRLELPSGSAVLGYPALCGGFYLHIEDRDSRRPREAGANLSPDLMRELANRLLEAARAMEQTD